MADLHTKSFAATTACRLIPVPHQRHASGRICPAIRIFLGARAEVARQGKKEEEAAGATLSTVEGEPVGLICRLSDQMVWRGGAAVANTNSNRMSVRCYFRVCFQLTSGGKLKWQQRRDKAWVVEYEGCER